MFARNEFKKTSLWAQYVKGQGHHNLDLENGFCLVTCVPFDPELSKLICSGCP